MILVDLNVILDVVQKREPHYRASASLLDLVIRKKVDAALPAHAVTTVHFILSRHQSADVASQVVEWLLSRFAIATVGKAELIRAQALGWTDFEHGVVAAAAESSGCKEIVTRNIRDFRTSPVSAVTPEEYLVQFDRWGPD